MHRYSIVLVALWGGVGAACSLSGAVGVVHDKEGTSTTSGGEETAQMPPPDGTDLLLDLPAAPIGGCAALGIGEELAKCSVEGPPDAFNPTIQWAWAGDGEYTESFVSPLVANLNDDTNDGIIDLCDTPDIVVVVTRPPAERNIAFADPARIYVLDGDDSTVNTVIDAGILPGYTPALADVDSDGLIDIVAVREVDSQSPEPRARLVAFTGAGDVLWEGGTEFPHAGLGAVAVADLDGDGSVEILVDAQVMDARGDGLFAGARVAEPVIPIAVDLDGDGAQEVLWGNAAARADGTTYFDLGDRDIPDGYAVVADLDRDGDPEIFLAIKRGLLILDADGTILLGPLTPEIGADGEINDWRRLATVHDLDGDRIPEVALSVNNRFIALNYVPGDAEFRVRFSSPVNDPGGWAGVTAFDFLGDTRSEAAYADTHTLYLYDLEGRGVLEVPRTSITLLEYPVVADVDNDGSAEIVVVSNVADSLERAPTVRVFGEALSRWVPSRRIWNQHTYHVTNIEEDGTVPRRETPHWRALNTFRTNAQIEEGAVCEPEG